MDQSNTSTPSQENPASKVDHKLDHIDTLEIVRLKQLRNLTYKEIADKFGVSKQAIHQRLGALRELIGNPEINKAYKEREAEFLDSIQVVLDSNLLDRSKIEKASLNNVAYASDRIANRRSLLRGQATENIGLSHALHDMTRDQEHHDSMRAMLEKRIADLQHKAED